MSDIEKRIGGKITEIRLARRNTQAELAEMVGLSVESISRLERGVSFPSLKTIERIAVALEVSLKDFFEFDESPAKELSYERELARLVGYLRTLDEEELGLARRILKAVMPVVGAKV